MMKTNKLGRKINLTPSPSPMRWRGEQDESRLVVNNGNLYRSYLTALEGYKRSQRLHVMTYANLFIQRFKTLCPMHPI